MGLGGPVVSAVEDAGAVGLTLTALIAPILAIVALIAIVVVAGRTAARRLSPGRRAALRST